MTETGSRDQTFARAEDKSLLSMVLFTRAIGQTTNAVVRAGLSKLTALLSMKVNIKKTNAMV